MSTAGKAADRCQETADAKSAATRLGFTACEVPTPCQLFWRVRIRGSGAGASGQRRGEVSAGATGSLERTESSSFSGNHYVEVYAIKGRVCVARARIDVPIEACRRRKPGADLQTAARRLLALIRFPHWRAHEVVSTNEDGQPCHVTIFQFASSASCTIAWLTGVQIRNVGVKPLDPSRVPEKPSFWEKLHTFMRRLPAAHVTTQT